MDFPMPFGGINRYVHFDNRERLAAFLRHVANGCGKHHDHNIAVAFDGDKLYGTELLLGECFKDWLREGRS